MKDCAEFAVAYPRLTDHSNNTWRIVDIYSAKTYGSNEAAKAEAERMAKVYNADAFRDCDDFKVLNLALYKLNPTRTLAYALNNFKA